MFGVRTMCGVIERTMSVLFAWSSVEPKIRLSSGIWESPGTPLSDFWSSSLIRPASMFVSPSCSRIVVSTERVPMIGCEGPLLCVT